MNRQRLFLALACALLAIVLGAPAPGSVSGCNVDSVPADPQAFCNERNRVECQRMRQRGEIDDAGLATCVAAVPETCVGFSFPVGCVATNTKTNACIAALRNLGNINVAFGNIPECRDLCQ